MHEECGVFGIWSPVKDSAISQKIYLGLYALQHRGQESAGIAVSDSNRIVLHKGVGLVGEVFKQSDFEKLSKQENALTKMILGKALTEEEENLIKGLFGE